MTDTSKYNLQIALVGNPNTGKSSIFNRLTGLNQHVGNFPGVTVDKKQGTVQLPNNTTAQILDLPGIYSLYPSSLDEKIALDILLNVDTQTNPDFPQLIIYVIEASNLERNLLLFTQLADLQFKLIIALNMNDIAKNNFITLNIVALQKHLQVPIISVNGRTGEGINALKSAIIQEFNASVDTPTLPPFFNIEQQPNTAFVAPIQQLLNINNTYKAALIAHHYRQLNFLNPQQKKQIAHILAQLPQPFISLHLQVSETLERYDYITPLTLQIVKKTNPDGSETFSSKIDRILTHSFWGFIVFLGILFFMFQAIYSWTELPTELIENAFAQLTHYLNQYLPANLLTQLLTEGILAGLSGILVFVPQIALLSAMIAILEESGYMARAMFLSDSTMRKFGLNGRSIVALISGAACAVPAITSTRSIANLKERLITIFATPFISCSARVPVFALLVGFVVPNHKIFNNLFNARGLVIMALYLMGVIAALGSSWVLNKVLKNTEKSFFLLELPTYKAPHWKNILLTVYEKTRTFVIGAGKVIIVISMLIWALSSFGPKNEMQLAEQKVRQQYTNTQSLTETQLTEMNNAIAAQRLEYSYAGYIGKTIEPIIKPLGFDWKIGIALITSFAAREVFVGTMATIYSVGNDPENTETLTQKMKNATYTATNKPVYTTATAASLLMFYVFAMQCMSTLAVVKRETKTWKWAILQLVYMTTLAYIASFIAYNVLS